MYHAQRTLVALAIALAVIVSGCTGGGTTTEKQDPGGIAEGRGEHARDKDGGGEGEESGTELALNDTYDKVRNGARLVLAYDAQSNSFNGTVENTTDKILERVRVEVHLSNGKELGPTTPTDLAPGKKMAVKLAATGRAFKGWSAHPEVGNEEHAGGEHGGEGRGEHGGEGRGEHGGEGRGEHGAKVEGEAGGESRGEHGDEGRSEHSREGRGEHGGETRGEHGGE